MEQRDEVLAMTHHDVDAFEDASFEIDGSTGGSLSKGTVAGEILNIIFEKQGAQSGDAKQIVRRESFKGPSESSFVPGAPQSYWDEAEYSWAGFQSLDPAVHAPERAAIHPRCRTILDAPSHAPAQHRPPPAAVTSPALIDP